MAVIALTLAPALTVALTLTLASEGALVTLTNPPPGAAAHTLTLAPAGPVVLAAVAELLRGPKGEPGAAGPGPTGTPGDLNATHLQALAADIWQVVHNLGKRPAVTVVDSAGDTVEGSVSYLDSNRLSITFSAAFSGSAFLN